MATCLTREATAQRTSKVMTHRKLMGGLEFPAFLSLQQSLTKRSTWSEPFRPVIIRISTTQFRTLRESVMLTVARSVPSTLTASNRSSTNTGKTMEKRRAIRRRTLIKFLFTICHARSSPPIWIAYMAENRATLGTFSAHSRMKSPTWHCFLRKSHKLQNSNGCRTSNRV